VSRDLVDRETLVGDPVVVAPLLLGKLLVSTVGGIEVAGRIVEVEAYREDDPASHSFRGVTARTATMFGPAGHLYVYLSYGIHHCANVVTGREGSGAAVLLRSVEPLVGLATVRTRRSGRPDRELADGPGKLCQALSIGLSHDGTDLCSAHSPVTLHDDGTAPPNEPVRGPRVGITKGVDRPWRFRIPE